MPRETTVPKRSSFPGRVPISASIPSKDKDAVALLVRKGYYPSDSDFVARAVSYLLQKCKGQGKFKWKELEL